VLWLWICFAGGIGLLAEGDWATGTAAVCAGLVTLVYIASPNDVRWTIRAVLVVVWFVGGVLLWNWTVEDWAVAGRIAFAALGGGAILAYVVRRYMGAERPGDETARG
jgi:hypothetical protein